MAELVSALEQIDTSILPVCMVSDHQFLTCMLQELPEHVERLMKLAGHSKLGPWLLVSTSEHTPAVSEQRVIGMS